MRNLEECKTDLAEFQYNVDCLNSDIDELMYDLGVYGDAIKKVKEEIFELEQSEREKKLD